MKYLLFIGSGRTGSTLVGHLLNLHPNIAVTNEMRLLESCVHAGSKVRERIPELVARARQESADPFLFKKGDSWRSWQRDWLSLGAGLNTSQDDAAIFAVGDKKQGGNAKLFRGHRSAAWCALDGLEVIALSCVRSVQRVIQSYVSLGFSDAAAIDASIPDMLTGIDEVERAGARGLFLTYETVLLDPVSLMQRVCEVVGVPAPDSWLEIVRCGVRGEKSRVEALEPIAPDLKRSIEFKHPGSIARIEFALARGACC